MKLLLVATAQAACPDFSKCKAFSDTGCKTALAGALLTTFGKEAAIWNGAAKTCTAADPGPPITYATVACDATAKTATASLFTDDGCKSTKAGAKAQVIKLGECTQLNVGTWVNCPAASKDDPSKPKKDGYTALAASAALMAVASQL